MKIYVSNNTLEKLEEIVRDARPDFITVRKYRKGSDVESNCIQGVNLSDKQRQRHKTGKTYQVYISKNRLRKVKKLVENKPEEYREGGILPLIPLLLGGIGALGSLAGGSAAIAKTMIDKKANDAKLEEEKRHNVELEKAARGEGLFLNPYKEGAGCLKQVIKDFTNTLNTDEVGRKTIRSILKNMFDYVRIRQERNGNGLYLQPYPQ